MSLPQWAKKPKHKKEVVATPRGWMVKDTGEMLKLVKNLDERLEDLKQQSLDESLESISKTDNEDPAQTHSDNEAIAKTEEPTVTSDDKTEEPSYKPESKEEKPKPKKKGRPRKTTPYTDK